jgi:hypothetical protein
MQQAASQCTGRLYLTVCVSFTVYRVFVKSTQVKQLMWHTSTNEHKCYWNCMMPGVWFEYWQVSQPNRTAGVVTDSVLESRGCSQATVPQGSTLVLFWALGRLPGTSFKDTYVKHKVLIAHLISDLRARSVSPFKCVYSVSCLLFISALKCEAVVKVTRTAPTWSCVPGCPGASVFRITPPFCKLRLSAKSPPVLRHVALFHFVLDYQHVMFLFGS